MTGPDEEIIGDDRAREAMDRLNDQNRVLLEARMLPPHTTLTDEQMNAIRERFKSYLKEHEVKAARVARETQYSSSTLSSWLAGRYGADASGVTRAMNNWMERDARRRQNRRPKDYVATRVAEDMRSIVYQADKHTRMAVIVAPSGTGKTKVLKVLTEEMNGVYVCCSESMTIRGLYLAIAGELEWNRTGEANKHELERYIIERLTSTRRVLFIDEAHQLGSKIRAVRTIHDQAQVPIVLAGTDEIEGSTDDRAHGRGQFKSRCVFFNALKLDDDFGDGDKPGTSAGTRPLFTAEEIRKFFDLKKIRLDRDGFKLCWALACLTGHGCLRLLEQIVEWADALTGASDGDTIKLTRDEILAALRMVDPNTFGLMRRDAERQLKQWDEPAAAIAV